MPTPALLDRLHRAAARALPTVALMAAAAVPVALPTRPAEAQRTAGAARGFRWTPETLANAVLEAAYQANTTVELDRVGHGKAFLLVHNVELNVMWWEDRKGVPTTEVPISRALIQRALRDNRFREEGSRDRRFDPQSLPRTLALMLEPTRVLHANTPSVSALTAVLATGAEFDAASLETLMNRYPSDQRSVIRGAIDQVLQETTGQSLGSYDAAAGRRRAEGRTPSDNTSDEDRMHPAAAEAIRVGSEILSDQKRRAEGALDRVASRIGDRIGQKIRLP